ELLGQHQDATVAVDHLRELSLDSRHELPPATVFVMGQIAARYLRQAAELRREFPKTYRQFEGSNWRALREKMAAKQPKPLPKGEKESAPRPNGELLPESGSIAPESSPIGEAGTVGEASSNDNQTS